METRRHQDAISRRGFFGACASAALVPAIAQLIPAAPAPALPDTDLEQWAQLWDAVDSWPNGIGSLEYDMLAHPMITNSMGAEA